MVGEFGTFLISLNAVFMGAVLTALQIKSVSKNPGVVGFAIVCHNFRMNA